MSRHRVAVFALAFAAMGVWAMQPTETTVIDFRGGGQPWPSIDDVVMGGVSNSEMVLEDGFAVFRGTVSLENNGGFASVRSRPVEHDLSSFDGLVLRIRGDGKRYGFRLRTSAAFDGVSYQVAFNAPTGEWRELRLPFDTFEPVFRGRRVSDHPPLDPAKVVTFGLIISDKQDGPFQLDLEWIEGFRIGAIGAL
jgi:NADH dehydrogenase [ubiquinone] 1 alpha subcomplex assembly factor 1